MVRAALTSIVATAVLSVASGHAAGAQTACTLDRATGTTIDPKPFLAGAYLTRWNYATNMLADMAPDAQGYYRVFTIRPDGTGRHDVAANLPPVPQKHQGLPSWHPSGRYLMFIAQKKNWSGPKLFGVPDYEGVPGFGLHDDIWLVTAAGTRAWQLTNDANTSWQGILMPVFSPDGAHIAWAQRQPDKSYVIDVADFIERPQPHLGTIRSYTPGGNAYYEPGSFTSDGKSLLYTSDQDTHSFWLSQIYRLDLTTGTSTRLTEGLTYNEHPIAMTTPSGEWVVYMSTKDNRRFPLHPTLGTDWWAVRLDGTGAKRLTSMNVPGSPQSSGRPEVAITSALSPTGTFMFGDVQTNLAKQTGDVFTVNFTCGAGADARF
jgi:hypothetical protein